MNDNYDEHTITDAEQIDYEEIENAFYNALVEFNESQEADQVSTDSLNSDVLEFASVLILSYTLSVLLLL